MHAVGNRGSIVTLICDAGDRYAGTYYDDAWVAAAGLDLAPYRATLDRFARDRRVGGAGLTRDDAGGPAPAREPGLRDVLRTTGSAGR